jgi:hypothetical protein
MSLGFCSGVIKMSNWKKRTFKLNASMLTYYDEKNVPKGSLAVSAMIQVDAVEEGGCKHGLVVTHYDVDGTTLDSKEHTLVCDAASDEDRDAWIAALRKAIKVRGHVERPPPLLS